METCKTEDDCETPMWCRGKDKCQKHDAKEQDLGPWAVPSKGDKLNGDPGPAQRTRLAWSRAHYIRQIWEGLADTPIAWP